MGIKATCSVAKRRSAGERVAPTNINRFSGIGANWVNAFAPGSGFAKHEASRASQTEREFVSVVHVSPAYLGRIRVEGDVSLVGKDQFCLLSL